MNPMIGYCGLDCGGCLIHVATLENNEPKKSEMRSDIARICKERYSLSFEPGDINDCDGCQSERLFTTCARCEIRNCAREKGLTSCAYCNQYTCEKLKGMFLEDPAARQRLESLRSSGN